MEQTKRLSLRLIDPLDVDFEFVYQFLAAIGDREPKQFETNEGGDVTARMTKEWVEWNNWVINRAKIHKLERDGILIWVEYLGVWTTRDGRQWISV